MTINGAIPPVPATPRNLRNLQLQRRFYRRPTDWLFAWYDRLLNSRLGLHLPMRGRVRGIRLVGVENELYVRLGTTDWMVVSELVMDGGYDRVISLKLQNVRQIVDLGANIGISVRLWQMHFGSARILAVEPDDLNLEMCKRNADAGAGRSVFIQACAGARNRWVSLDRSGGQWATRMGNDDDGVDSSNKPSHPVAVLTVPELLEKAGFVGDIDLMKCDIEGAERELFAECSSWLPKIKTLLIELHDDYTPERFLADIERTGGKYQVETLDRGPNYAQLLLHGRGGEVGGGI